MVNKTQLESLKIIWMMILIKETLLKNKRMRIKLMKDKKMKIKKKAKLLKLKKA
jgi:hypothetical protein